MEKAAGHILKADSVKLEGRFHLDARQAGPSPAKEKTAVSEPAVRVVENKPEFAVIEITCSCGTKTHIKCEYTDGQSTDPKPDQTKINGENDNAN